MNPDPIVRLKLRLERQTLAEIIPVFIKSIVFLQKCIDMNCGCPIDVNAKNVPMFPNFCKTFDPDAIRTRAPFGSG